MNSVDLYYHRQRNATKICTIAIKKMIQLRVKKVRKMAKGPRQAHRTSKQVKSFCMNKNTSVPALTTSNNIAENTYFISNAGT